MVACNRLGIHIFNGNSTCPTCGQNNDEFGDHAILCATDGERIARHDRLRDAIFEAAASAALEPERECRDLFPNSTERPADVYLKSWVRGRDAALDVTITSPLQKSQVRREADHAGVALEAAKQRKMTRYYETCDNLGVELPCRWLSKPLGVGSPTPSSI
jgi:hypothetical protein